MRVQYTQRLGRTLTEYRWVNGANLKSLLTVWFHLLTSWEKQIDGDEKQTGSCQGLRREVAEEVKHRGFVLGQWNYSTWHYNSGYLLLCICQNPWNFIAQWTLKYARFFLNPKMKCRMWQNNLYCKFAKQLHGRGYRGKRCWSKKLELSGVCKTKGEKIVCKYYILAKNVVSHGR